MYSKCVVVFSLDCKHLPLNLFALSGQVSKWNELDAYKVVHLFQNNEFMN